jgi:hypothetical protein
MKPGAHAAAPAPSAHRAKAEHPQCRSEPGGIQYWTAVETDQSMRQPPGRDLVAERRPGCHEKSSNSFKYQTIRGSHFHLGAELLGKWVG